MPGNPLFLASKRRLTVQDFVLLTVDFKTIISNHIPTCQTVNFYNHKLLTVMHSLPSELMNELSKFADCKKDYNITETSIYFKIVVDDGAILVLLDGLDEDLLGKMDNDWLQSEISLIKRDLLSFKGEYLDPLTGILNSKMLLRVAESEELNLMLVEITPKGSLHTFFENQLSLSIQVLKSLNIEGRFYYVGHLLFAITLDNNSNVENISHKILQEFRKSQVKRLHIGSSSTIGFNGNALDNAWSALKETRKRGNFSFCAYSSLVNLKEHPLYGLEDLLKSQINQNLLKYKSFSVVIFKCSGDIKSLLVDLSIKYRDYNFFTDNIDILCVLPNSDQDETKRWADNIIFSVKGHTKISAGISYYPNKSFSKLEVLSQARKALQHTLFYGECTSTIVDALTLNISGDIYYGEGNILNAIKEYRAAVAFNPLNINALNSLGVAYAMNGNRKGMEYFERVLELDECNFLAFYNKGVVYEGLRDFEQALYYYEQALKYKSELGLSASNIKVKDLELQLGIMAAKIGKWNLCLDLLLPFTLNIKTTPEIAHYVGLSYGECGEVKEGVRWLQNAMGDPLLDPKTYSFLGYYYYLLDEGVEVAKSLCLKAISLEPQNKEFKDNMTKILLSNGEFDQADELMRETYSRNHWKTQIRILQSNLKIIQN
ncbi:MAG: tetratricopeptide repeat protein [Desulfotalea sp.]